MSIIFLSRVSPPHTTSIQANLAETATVQIHTRMRYRKHRGEEKKGGKDKSTKQSNFERARLTHQLTSQAMCRGSIETWVRYEFFLSIILLAASTSGQRNQQQNEENIHGILLYCIVLYCTVHTIQNGISDPLHTLWMKEYYIHT